MVSPAWTPDGQYLVVSKSRPPDPGTFWLFMYHRDGGNGVRVGAPPPPQPSPDATGPPPPPPPNRMGAVVSPDGRFIYYAQRTGGFTYNTRFPLWQIYRHDRDTGDVSQVTNAQGSAMRPVLSPDGKWLVYGTRHKTDTGLRIRNLETGAERWLAYPVTRDDQESRATRDTLPRYDFLPDGRSIVVPIAGKLQRIDVASGQATPIPFTARVQAEVAAARLHAGAHRRWPAGAGAPDPLASGVARRIAAGVQRAQPPLRDGAARRHAAAADHGATRASSCRRGRPTASRSPTSRGPRRAATSSACRPAAATPATLTAPRRLLPRSGVHARRHAAWPSWPAPPPISSTPSCSTRRRPITSPRTWREIGGITPPNTIEIRWMPADGGTQTLVASAQGGRGLHFARNDNGRVYFTTSRGLQSITLEGLDRRTLVRVQGVGPGNNPPAADDIVLSPDGTRAFVNLQNKHYLVSIPRAGRETVEVKIEGRAENTAVPVTRMSADGGDYLAWTGDGASVTWSWGAQFFRQAVEGAEPQKLDVTVEVPRARPSGSILLTGARIITMNGDEVIESGDVLVTDNRIAAVGERGKVAAAAGIRRLDLRGKTVMPGLVDVHAHMWAPRGLHQTAVWQYYANLAYGVTTTRDPQTSTPDVFAYADMVDAGMMPGPRVFATGPGVFSTSGIEDRESAFRFVKRYKEAYRTNTIKQYVAGDRIVRQWIIEASREYGITPTIEGSLDLKLNLTQIADGYTGQEHSFPIMPLHKDVVEFVARTKTFYTPTILVAYGAPWTENHWFETENTVGDAKLNKWIPNELLDTMIRRRPQWFAPEEYGHTKLGKQVADIVHAGGRAGLGSHGQLQGLGAHWETWNLGSGGLTPHETLKVITIFGAEALGLQQDVGSVEAGKLADLLVLDANPLVNIRNTNTVRYVMKNGELYDADTLNTIWPTAKTLPKPFWWDTAPPKQ